jgi:hypothetical protein
VSNTSTQKKPRDRTPQRGPREGSTIWAAMEVLRGKRKPMTAAEIYAEIREAQPRPGPERQDARANARRPARGQRQARSLRRAH